MKHTKAKEPRKKRTSSYLRTCIENDVYKAILKVIYEKVGARPKEVYKSVSKILDISANYLNVYLQRLLKYGVVQKSQPYREQGIKTVIYAIPDHSVKYFESVFD